MRILDSRLINSFLLTALLLAKVTCAQNLELQSGQSVIHGEINGMKVMAQGDAVAFFAARKPSPLLNDEQCQRDLNCAMQKNRTEAVVLHREEGILLFENSTKYAPENVTFTEPLYPVTSDIDGLDNTAIETTPTHIPLAFPQPSTTLHTGNDAVDKTQGILLVNSPMMTWLAETVTTVSYSRQAMGSEETLSPIIEPTSTQKAMLTTITEEEDELLRKLTSTLAMPMPTPTPTLVENRLWEDGLVRLEIETDILSIKPSPSGQYEESSGTTSSFTYSVKKVPTVSADTAPGNQEASSTVSGSTSTDSPQASNLPTSKKQGVEEVTVAAQAKNLETKEEVQKESDKTTVALTTSKYSVIEKKHVLNSELSFDETVDNMNILAVFPNGSLIVKADPAPFRRISLSQQEQVKNLKTIEVSPNSDAAIVIDSSQFIVRSANLYTYYLKRGGSWIQIGLGEFLTLEPLSDGRFVTAPVIEQDQHQGVYQAWSLQNNQLVSIPLGEAYGRLSVLEKTNRVMTFHDNGVVKIWTDENGVWTASLLSENTMSRKNIGFILELGDGRLISIPIHQSTLGVWYLVSGIWRYDELLSCQNEYCEVEAYLLADGSFVSFQGFSERSSVKLWTEREGKWQAIELEHFHREKMKMLPINVRQFLTCSSDSVKVWTCLESCSFTELIGTNNLRRFYPLSNGRFVTVTSENEIGIWYEHELHWIHKSLGKISRMKAYISKIVELAQGYLAVEYTGFAGMFVSLRYTNTRFFDISLRTDQQESKPVAK